MTTPGSDLSQYKRRSNSTSQPSRMSGRPHSSAAAIASPKPEAPSCDSPNSSPTVPARRRSDSANKCFRAGTIKWSCARAKLTSGRPDPSPRSSSTRTVSIHSNGASPKSSRTANSGSRSSDRFTPISGSRSPGKV